MAASTITRDAWTNDTGSFAAPVSDGTVIANTVLQNHIYARIDAMFAGAGAYATLTFGGKIAAEGFGTHIFSAGGTGAQALAVRNTAAGTGNFAQVTLGNDNNAAVLEIDAFSSTYTTTGAFFASGALLYASGSGGLSISAAHASGAMRFYAGGGVERGRLWASGGISWGNTSDPGAGGVTYTAVSLGISGSNAANPVILSLTNTSASGRTELKVLNDSGFIGQLATYGSTYATTTLRNKVVLSSSGTGSDIILTADGTDSIRITAGTGAVRFNTYGAGTATFDASGNITSVSDARHKDRIAPLPYGLLEVLALHPVQHGYNEASGLERDHLYGGFLAQDVQAVMPIAVGRDPQGGLTLADRPILGALVNAVRELHTEVLALRAQRA